MMSIHGPISKTITNKGDLEKIEDIYMIRKVKGAEEVRIPLVFIYLSSSFFLRLISNSCKERTDLVGLFPHNYSVLPVTVECIGYWWGLWVDGGGISSTCLVMALSYQHTHVHPDQRPVQESIHICRSHQCWHSAHSCRSQVFHTH